MKWTEYLFKLAQSISEKWELGDNGPSISDATPDWVADDGKVMKKCFQFPNKRRYNIKKDAETAILLSDDKDLNCYHCDSCSGWHLTSKQK